MPESFKRWLPAVLLLIFMALLIAAIRVYVGGPDGLEVVWKGMLSLDDTVVNVDDYRNIPRKDILAKPTLLSQMEEMGLYESSETPVELLRKRRAKKLRLKKNADVNRSDAGSISNGSGSADAEEENTDLDSSSHNDAHRPGNGQTEPSSKSEPASTAAEAPLR